MKTISDYTIHCTPEQTRKALELGAPILTEIYMPIMRYEMPYFCIDHEKRMAYHLPTAEQMCGWLEEQGFYFYIMNDFDWYIEVKYHNNWFFREEKLCSRKEATLAAIDAALEYLSNNKK